MEKTHNLGKRLKADDISLEGGNAAGSEGLWDSCGQGTPGGVGTKGADEG